MVVTGKTLNEVQIATVCKAILEALHFMQVQSKIHRDIKPHNVLINQFGAAKLCAYQAQKVCKERKFFGAVINFINFINLRIKF